MDFIETPNYIIKSLSKRPIQILFEFIKSCPLVVAVVRANEFSCNFGSFKIIKNAVKSTSFLCEILSKSVQATSSLLSTICFDLSRH